MHQRRTKIVCTIGPTSNSPEKIRALIRAGLSVARLNFSHGTYKEHEIVVKRLRAAAKIEKKTIAILQDLQGPKIRVGVLPDGGVHLTRGEELILTTKKVDYDPKRRLISVSYAGMHHDLKSGDRLLLDDGLLELEVQKISGHEIHTKIIIGGELSSHKGVNVPTATLNVDPMTEKDRNDLAFGLKLGVDWVALSFVTSADQVKRLKRMIRDGLKGSSVTEPKVIVKIEKHEALTNFDEILAAADGVMVARGDLGIETPAVRVPIEQKIIIEKCRAARKPVVVATQMLDSMIRNPRPTRAEISDVANAVIDHTDATMLSGETASGKYPVEAVKVMAETISVTEESRFDDLSIPRLPEKAPTLVARVVNAVRLAKDAGASVLVIASDTGEKVRLASSLRQEIPIIAAVPDATLGRQLMMSWGVNSILVPSLDRNTILKTIHHLKLVKKGAAIVFLDEIKASAGVLVI